MILYLQVFYPCLHFQVTEIPPAELFFCCLSSSAHSLAVCVGLFIHIYGALLSSLQRPEVQVQVLRFQDVYGRSSGANVDPGVGGPGPRKGRVRRGEDVVDAELDLGLWFALRAGLGGRGVSALGAWPVGVQGAEGGVAVGPALLDLRRMEGRLAGVPEADFHIPPAAAAAEVAVFEQVEHGFAAGGESPEVPLPLLVALRPRDLQEGEHVLCSE